MCIRDRRIVVPDVAHDAPLALMPLPDFEVLSGDYRRAVRANGIERSPVPADVARRDDFFIATQRQRDTRRPGRRDVLGQVAAQGGVTRGGRCVWWHDDGI